MRRIDIRLSAVLAAALAVAAAGGAPARADVFDGRIAFTSFRADPALGLDRGGDVFSMNADGTDQRRLTTNPACGCASSAESGGSS
jgi:hypothetical protein